jgi:hypothetical protein
MRPEFDDKGREKHDRIGNEELRFRHPTIRHSGGAKVRRQAIREQRKIMYALRNRRQNNGEK